MKSALMVPALAALTLCGCTTAAPVGSGPAATAHLHAADGSDRGTVRIEQIADGLRVSIRAAGLTPGIHGAHVHMTGNCTAPDFASAGGHWNPMGRQHGSQNPQGMHMGDMPNLVAGADGSAALDYVIAGGVLEGGAGALLDADGAALVIHANADDLKSDPAGNAGGRIACGVLAKI